ncbi:alpha-soluble NSF attachment protein [Venturia nashicola]|uniref:Alpha-soluble NSF attachment protein n=1 Tax=Venturia nashicola TaxID=86259 RepID=A0A4Z1PJX4_9PEZI|nr:alpha-soluble NSF attachment protein [Venturia nashicola]TLD35211.1 alpha-soluble NSF attachment protein [Venturia nashicola]
MAVNGDSLYRKAETTLNSKTGWFSGVSKEEKLENAAEEFSKAADRYKLEQNYKRAGEVFEKSAAIYTQLAAAGGSSQETGYSGAARAFDEAHVAYKMISPELGIPPLKKSIEGFQNASNLRRAATKWEELAKLYEEAIANKSRVRNAELTAVLANDDFNALNESKEIYLAVARSNLANNTLRFAVKDHLFHYGLVSLSFMDEPTIANDFAIFPQIDKQFLATREHNLLQEIFQAIKDQDPDQLQQKVNIYANLSALKPWEETMIGRIEDKLRAAEEDFS